LVVDLATVVILPFPNFFNELLSAKVVPGLLCPLPELLFDNALGSDTSVVNTWEPERLISLHSLLSDNGVFNGEHEGVTQMECTCNIWWWNNHGECLSCFDSLFGIRLEEVLLLPPRIPGSLNLLGVVDVEHWLAESFFSPKGVLWGSNVSTGFSSFFFLLGLAG